MKKILILSVIVLSLTQIYAQDNIDPIPLFRKDTLGVYDHRENKFILSWNWGAPSRSLDQTLNMNSYHYLPPRTWGDVEYTTDMADSIKDIDWLAITGRTDTVMVNGMSLFLNPTSTIDKNDNTFQLRWNDIDGGVFGFKYHNWTVGDTSPNGADQHRFVLRKSNLIGDSAIVLDNAWNGSILRFLGYLSTNNHGRNYDNSRDTFILDSINTQRDVNLYHPYNGKQWYLSINLRALDKADLALHLTDTILAITLPFVLFNDSTNIYSSGQITFDSLPKNTTTDTFRILGNYDQRRRGIAKQNIAVNRDSVFYITGNMLVANMASPDNTITLSAFFKNDGYKYPITQTYRNNPTFKQDAYPTNINIREYIDTINVQVKYYGKTDVAISWLRLETPNMRRLIFGWRDAQIRVKMDSVFNRLRRNPNHPLLYRFYGADEFLPCQFGVMRYFNMLTDTVVAAEVYIEEEDTPQRTLKATGFKEFWTGSTVYHKPAQSIGSAVPYFKRANTNWLLDGKTETFKTLFGYAGNNFTINQSQPYRFSDTLNSEYETFLIRASWGNPAYQQNNYRVKLPVTGEDTLLFDKIIEWSSDYYLLRSTQASIEALLRNDYYKYPKLLYNSKPWWANLWIENEISYDTDPNYQTIYYSFRPKTGEEIRLMTSSAVNLGAKGIVYYEKGFGSNVLSGGAVGTLLKSDSSTFLQRLPTGETLAYSNLNGGDYIDLNDDNYYNFKDGLNITKYDWNQLGINPQKVYFGNKSTTVELYKIGKWIRTVEPTLMNMKLAAWYGKGFLTMYSQDAQYGSDSILTKFISLDTNRLFTKKIWNPTTFTAQYKKESFDSSFFDVCLHKDGRYGLDTVFYLAVTNRRTDPLIHPCDTIKANPIYIKPKTDNGMLTTGDVIDCGVKFYSTAEYDSAVRYGGYIIDKTGTYPLMSSQLYRDTTYWREQFWKRFGCREIHIPFKYRYTTKADNYTLLHITELGKGTPLDTNWWFNAPYRHVIDTVIQRDSALIVKLLPGEGKILKVEILYPIESTFKGQLAYSNQRKLVAYPFHKNNLTETGSTDTVIYHVVYHKPIDTDTNRLGVYYRRSKPMLRNTPTNIIDWETTEYLLSDSIQTYNMICQPLTKYKTKNCGYPSLVVNLDTLEPNPLKKNKVYAVYACECENEGYTTNYIAENIFPANMQGLLNIGTSRVLSQYYSGSTSLPVWGTPVINASYNGNFYAWSDTTNGIVTAFKTQADTCIQPGNKINLSANTVPSLAHALHPSLNTYSRIRLGERDCGLVWQEYPTNYFLNNQIYYTRLRYDGAGLQAYLPQSFFDVSIGWVPIINNNTAQLSSQVTQYNNTFPIVYRGVENYEVDAADSLNLSASHWDRVYWQADTAMQSMIVVRSLDIQDTLVNNYPQPWKWNALYPFRIKSLYGNLSQADAAQGYIRTHLVNGVPVNTNQNDSIITLTFKEDAFSHCCNLWQLNQSYWNLFAPGWWQKLDTNIQNYGLARMIYIRGNYPHLAAFPYLTNRNDWRIQREIMEMIGAVHPFVGKSLQYFYRNSDEYKDGSYPFYGFENEHKQYLLTPVWLVNDNGITSPQVNIFNYDGITVKLRDTLSTEWFSLGDKTKLRFLQQGNGNNNVTMKIERKSDGKKYNLNLPFEQSHSIKKQNYTLINGKNDYYRIIWKNPDSDLHFTEELLIDGIPTVEDYENGIDNDKFGRTVNEQNEQYIDLSDISISTDGKNISLLAYPNPADDYIVATAYISYNELMSKQHKLLIKVVSTLGIELYRQEVKPGETIMLDTKDYPQGAYFIRAEEKTGNYLDDRLTPAIQGFVIKR